MSNNKRKRSRSDDSPLDPKRRKIEISKDYFSFLPKEIFHHILAYVDRDGILAIKILSMTCKKFEDALSENENHLWHSIYLRAKFHINADTVKKNSHIVSEMQFWDNMNKYDTEIMLDAYQAQQELYNSPTTYIEAEEEHKQLTEESYSPEWFCPKPLDLAKDKFDPSVNYRELAIDCWWKRLQFELLLKLEPYHQKMLKKLPKNDERKEDDKEKDSQEDDEENNKEDDSEEESSSVKSEPAVGYSVESEEMCDSMDSDQMSAVSEIEDNDQLSLSSDEAMEDEEDNDTIISEPQYLERESTEAFLCDISTSEHFSLFIGILNGAAIGHMPRLDYAVTVDNVSNCTCSLMKSDKKRSGKWSNKGAEFFFEHIKQALSLDSIPCVQHIVCALAAIGIDDVLFLKELVKEKYPYLAIIYSVYDIEEHYFRFYDNEDVFPPCYYFNADLDADGTKLPDSLALNISMFRLMRQAGVYSGTPNATGYAIESLSDFIKSVIGTILQNKNITPNETDNTTVDVDACDVQKALISMSIDREYDHHKIHYRGNEWLNENELMMFSDSECETYASSYEDESVEDEDLSKYTIQQKVEKVDGMDEDEDSVDEEEMCNLMNNFIDNDNDEYTPLNDLLKQNIPGLSTVNDNSPLLINTAIRHAQMDEIKEADMACTYRDSKLGSVADEKEKELRDSIEQLEPEYGELDQLEGQELTEAWMKSCLHQEACYYHGTTKLDNKTINNFIEKYGEDLPINELSEEKQKQILDIRRETNRLLKEQFSSEKNEFEIKKWQRLQDNYDKYCKEISAEDMEHCKSLEIKLMIDNKMILSIIERAIKIISNCKNLKTVKLRILWIESELNLEKELSKLFDQLQKCQTLEGLIVTDQVPPFVIRKFLQKKKLKRFQYQAEFDDELIKTIVTHQKDSLKDFYIENLNAENLKPFAPLLENIEVLRTEIVQSDDETTKVLKNQCKSLQRVHICNNSYKKE